MPKHKKNAEVIVIGAGAAGLAAAAELATHGRAVRVFEGRDRIGGRILTRDEPGVSTPIELGAEFIHGKSPAVLAWLERANEAYIDAAQTRWRSTKGKLVRAEGVFEEMKRGLSSIKRPKKDLPFAEFLETVASRRLSAASRAFARMLVEGFDAADATRVSTFEILSEWSGNSAADAPTFRPRNGYSTLVDAIATSLPAEQVRLQLNTLIQEIEWQRGRVCLRGTRLGKPFEFASTQAVITLPLGVLQLPPQMPGGVLFKPALTSKQSALDQLASGPVIKVILRFRSSFWETLDHGRYRDGAFFQAPGCTFPTFWTSLPIRSSTMTAWTAGPNAARLAGMSEHEIVSTAMQCLQTVFGPRARVKEQLVCAYSHDWQADTFACGAYSYVTAGGHGARKVLARPLVNTLFFAGEATDDHGEAATVAGALQSGRRAAQEALRAIRAQRL
jgi:monoamine oxidase